MKDAAFSKLIDAVVNTAKDYQHFPHQDEFRDLRNARLELEAAVNKVVLERDLLAKYIEQLKVAHNQGDPEVQELLQKGPYNLCIDEGCPQVGTEHVCNPGSPS